jgi:F-type H+-transporting ATPase subunit delta
MSVGAVAERYAQALFELGEEDGSLERMTEQLQAFAAAYEQSKELRSTLNNPILGAEERAGLLTAVAERLGVSPLAVNGLKLMARRRRLPALSAIVTRLTELVDKKSGVLRASVTTAAAMPESYYESLVTQLSSATRKKVILSRSIDEELIGGAIAKVGDTVIDGSIRGKLRVLERDLLSAVVAGAS